MAAVPKGNVDDILTIKEAKLNVYLDVGDVCRLLNMGCMCDFTVFKVSIEKCLFLWWPPKEKIGI